MDLASRVGMIPYTSIPIIDYFYHCNLRQKKEKMKPIKINVVSLEILQILKYHLYSIKLSIFDSICSLCQLQ